jgi:hypothetical protein
MIASRWQCDCGADGNHGKDDCFLHSHTTHDEVFLFRITVELTRPRGSANPDSSAPLASNDLFGSR